jgi:hypothetical protein
MKPRLTFDKLKNKLGETFDQIPEHREGANKQYSLKDAGMGAFSVFFTQSPSFLAHQRTMKQTKGKSNAESVFGMGKVPSDNQIRALLDPIEPSSFDGMYYEVLAGLKESGKLKQFGSYRNKLLIPIDGTWYFSSKKISCDNCNHKTNSDGSVTHYHAAITPIIAKAGKNQVIALPQEFIWPQDGHEKQDCERAAAKRWIGKHAGQFDEWQVTISGDDLFSNQPFCELLLNSKCNFILVCKPDSHIELYRWIDFLEAQGEVGHLSQRSWNGRYAEIYAYRYVNQVPIRGGAEALKANWCELTITREDTQDIIYRNSFITNFSLSEETVKPIVRDGRAHWKIENENNNILKTKGYHLEHSFGHGTQFLAATLISLNILAFLFHTVFDLVDIQYQQLRLALGTRKTFFNDIRALTRYMLFDNWSDLLDFMFTQLELVPP